MSAPLFHALPNVKALQATTEKASHGNSHDANTAGDSVYRASIDAPDSAHISSPTSPAMSPSTTECQPQPSMMPTTEMRLPSLESDPHSLAEAGASNPAQNSFLPNATSAEITSTDSTEQPENAQATVPSHEKKRKATTEEKEKERIEKKRKQEDAAAEKEAKRLKKLEESRVAKARTERQQNLMASFLKKDPTALSRTVNHSPTAVVKADAATASESHQGSETGKTAYELSFQPFFVKPGVTMAPPPFEMDDETREAKSMILDEYMHGDRGDFNPSRPFDATAVFDFLFSHRRGIATLSVRKIMESTHGHSSQNTSSIRASRSEVQAEQFINVNNQLNSISMKYLHFHEDVRPAYFGTATTPMTYHQIRRLSRRPTGRVLPLAYDYDSEAEWVEDDGEDLDEAEDEEEDMDGDEEMDDFVDDSEATATITRLGLEADTLPISTGLCFEDQRRLGPSPTMGNYRLEFLMDSLVYHAMIDPFSTEYWPAPIKKAPAPAATTAASPTQGKTISTLSSANPQEGASLKCTTATLDGKDGVPPDILEKFKRALISEECRDFSKATVIEVLAKKFASCTKLQVKVTLDTIAHRVTPVGEKKKSVKQWALLPSHDLK
ncbi:chromatin assembly factor 1 subunit A-domain-containing protein [Xylaria sp. CBS 124048]|nr:chromatin assembly factor 1 subunit A-domain-containing protein [Xylaria sp. CBS 124048]